MPTSDCVASSAVSEGSMTFSLYDNKIKNVLEHQHRLVPRPGGGRRRRVSFAPGGHRSASPTTPRHRATTRARAATTRRCPGLAGATRRGVAVPGIQRSSDHDQQRGESEGPDGCRVRPGDLSAIIVAPSGRVRRNATVMPTTETPSAISQPRSGAVAAPSARGWTGRATTVRPVSTPAPHRRYRPVR
jgi:hypothetical protein